MTLLDMSTELGEEIAAWIAERKATRENDHAQRKASRDAFRAAQVSVWRRSVARRHARKMRHFAQLKLDL